METAWTIEELRREIRRAAEQLERGEGIRLDDWSLKDFFEDIKARGRQRLESERRPDPTPD